MSNNKRFKRGHTMDFRSLRQIAIAVGPLLQRRGMSLAAEMLTLNLARNLEGDHVVRPFRIELNS